MSWTGTYGAYFVPQQTGYPTASHFGAVVAVTAPPGPQQAYDACQAVLAYQAFQQSVAEQPQYIKFVGTPKDIALLRKELEEGRPVRLIQQIPGGALGPLVNEIETQSISTASRPTISDADESSGGVRFRGPNGEFTYDEVAKLEQPAFFGVRDWNVPNDRQPGLPDDFGANRKKYDFKRLDQRLKEAGVLRVESKDGALRLTIAPLTKEQLINFSSEIVRYADLAIRLGEPALDGDRRIVEMARRFAGEQNWKIL
jgi:hypothetical protein